MYNTKGLIVAIFDKQILEIEGGYSNDLEDPGSETKYGISKRSYPNEDIRNMTPERATEIYLRDFWNPNNLQYVQDQTTANIIFRFIVHAGAYTATSRLQVVLNSFTNSVTVDGKLGPKTVGFVNACIPLRLQDALRVSICQYYLDIVNHNLSQEKYFKGWITRALL